MSKSQQNDVKITVYDVEMTTFEIASENRRLQDVKEPLLRLHLPAQN